jgi:hypothetical protein
LNTLKTPAGRRLLKNGALATGGLAGLAAVGAVAAYALHQKAGPAPVGALQGSPLSPLFANIYLHGFDVMLTKRGHHLVRYADDWVMACATQAEAQAAYYDALRALNKLHLKVNPAKTRVVGPEAKVEWLGAVIP